MLKDKVAVIYGAGGSVGSAVALAFAREGARVFLAGRTLAKLEIVAEKIKAINGSTDISVINALHKQEVEDHLAAIKDKAGSIDISFNLIGMDDEHGTVLTSMQYEKFVLPITNSMTSHFITATAAARYMAKQGAGVILCLTANVARKPYPVSGGFGVSCAAIEGLCRQLAVEEGKHGVRVVCIRSAGSPDAAGVAEAFKKHADAAGISAEAFEKEFAQITMLKRLPLLAEIANTAVLMASGNASAITAAVINATCGELAD